MGEEEEGGRMEGDERGGREKGFVSSGGGRNHTALK